jgi:ribosomal protein S18 acetylase RimI-like enzyme
MQVRFADEKEIDQLAKIWYEGWREAHEHLVPKELVRHRSLESFRNRLEAALARTRVVGPPGSPVGFSMIKDDELYQLYVAPEARGSGAAAALVADAEALLAANGFAVAWLACAIGNDRAARFYEKCGWRRVGTFGYEAETASGPIPLEVWRYEKSLTAGGRGGK